MAVLVVWKQHRGELGADQRTHFLCHDAYDFLIVKCRRKGLADIMHNGKLSNMALGPFEQLRVLYGHRSLVHQGLIKLDLLGTEGGTVPMSDFSQGYDSY